LTTHKEPFQYSCVQASHIQWKYKIATNPNNERRWGLDFALSLCRLGTNSFFPECIQFCLVEQGVVAVLTHPFVLRAGDCERALSSSKRQLTHAFLPKAWY
jgi:hypothetical protein